MTNCKRNDISEYDDISTIDQYQEALRAGLSEEEALKCCYENSRDNARTPMQWDDSANHGFSTADAKDIYLPVDTAEDAPTVAAQADDPASLLNSVKSLLAFRHAHKDLNSDAPFKVLYAPKAKDDYRPFVWQRGDLICAVNPAGVSIELPLELAEDLKIQYTIGQAEIVNDTLSMGAQSFVILG